jgi:hypothetical protein
VIGCIIEVASCISMIILVTNPSQYFQELVETMPSNISDHATFTVHTEVGNTEIPFSNKGIFGKENLVPFKKYARLSHGVNSSFLYHRQSHIILKYTQIDTGQSIALHFLLCSTTFITEPKTDTPHFTATQSFLNISGMSH